MGVEIAVTASVYFPLCMLELYINFHFLLLPLHWVQGLSRPPAITEHTVLTTATKESASSASVPLLIIRPSKPDNIAVLLVASDCCTDVLTIPIFTLSYP